MIRLRIHAHDDRVKMLGILAENGYLVTVEKEILSAMQYKSIPDSFVVIHEESDRESKKC